MNSLGQNHCQWHNWVFRIQMFDSKVVLLSTNQKLDTSSKWVALEEDSCIQKTGMETGRSVPTLTWAHVTLGSDWRKHLAQPVAVLAAHLSHSPGAPGVGHISLWHSWNILWFILGAWPSCSFPMENFFFLSCRAAWKCTRTYTDKKKGHPLVLHLLFPP